MFFDLLCIILQSCIFTTAGKNKHSEYILRGYSKCLSEQLLCAGDVSVARIHSSAETEVRPAKLHAYILGWPSVPADPDQRARMGSPATCPAFTDKASMAH